MVKITQMKKTTLRQSALRLALVALAVFSPLGLRAQQSLTVYGDNTTTNEYVPIYGYYADSKSKCEFIIPSEKISAMSGSVISAMKFYLDHSDDASYYSQINATFEVFVKEVSATTLSGFLGNSDATIVFNGTITIDLGESNVEIDIPFSSNYIYGGGNLLVGFYQTTTTGYNHTYWTGETQTTNTAWGGYVSSASAKQFLPKTTFTYEVITTPTITLPASASVLTGFTTPLTATLMNVTGTPTINYSSDNESVATVSGSGTTATVTGVSAGTATITATMTYNATTYTATCAITVEDPSYCSPSFSNPSDDHITNFTTTGGETDINNSSTYESGGYSDYYATHFVSIEAGNTLSCTVTPSSTSYSYGHAIWVDWNKNYEFESDERVAYSTAEAVGDWVGEFEVPSTTAAGDYRLRVLHAYNASSVTNPCLSATYGEGEDYKLTVAAASPYQKPQNLAVTNLTANGATITWEAPNTDVQSYEYQYREQGGTWSALTSTTTLSAPLSGLTGNTTYEFQVQALYAGDNESGFASKSFTTPCAAFSVDPTAYIYGFEDAADMDCWTLVNGETYTDVWDNATVQSNFGYEPARTGDNVFMFYYVDYDDTDPEYQTLISPELTDVPSTGLHVEFYYVGDMKGSGQETFRVGYSTTDNNLSSFTWGNEITNASTAYQRFLANYPAGTKYVAIQHTSDDQYYLFIDDITFEGAAACLEPTAVAANNITTTGAEISWTNGGEETAWDIFVTDDNTIVPDDLTTPTVAGTSTKPYPLTGLTHSTTYYVYVRAACSSTEHSAWSTSLTFHTECEGMDLPYSYSFEDGALSVCWNVLNTNTSYNNVTIGDGNANTGTHSLNFFRGSTAGDLVAVLPEVGAYDLSDYQFEFSAKGAYAGYEITVGIMTDPDDFTTFVPQGTTISTTTDYAEYKVRFNEYTGSGKYVAISVVRPSTVTYGYIYIDDIAINPIPSCIEPDGLTVSNEAPHGATFGWTSNGTETAWQLYISENSTAPADDINVNELIPATTNPFVLTSGLNAETEHYVWVRANCNANGYSTWVGPETFTTTIACPAPTNLDVDNITGHTTDLTWDGTSANYNIDYRTAEGVAPLLSEDFEDETSFNANWTVVNYSTSNTPGRNSNAGYNSSYGFRFSSYSSASTYEEHLINTTELTGLTNGVIEFYYKKSNSYAESFKVGYSSTDNDVASFTFGENHEATTSWQLFHEEIPAGTKYVSIQYTTTGCNYYIYIDDIVIGNVVAAGEWQHATSDVENKQLTGLNAETKYEVKVQGDCGSEGPSQWTASTFFTTDIACMAPTTLVAGTPGPNSVDLTWTKTGTETAWQICLNGDETHPVDVAESDVAITGTTVAYTLDGLTAETPYTVKVRANCGGIDGQSAWSNEESFTTAADCPVPVLEAAGITNVSGHTADVAWTGFTQNDSYKVWYRTASPGMSTDGLVEDFEDGTMPAGWTVEGPGSWTVGTGDYSTSTGAHGGTYNAKITHSSNGNQTYLVSPNLDLSSQSNLTVNMWYINRSWAGDIDGFGVYYRINGGEWNEIFASTDASSTWTEIDEALPAGAYAANCQFGFKMTDAYGYGVAIDDITIGNPQPLPAGAWQSKDVAAPATSTTLTGLDPETPYEVYVTGHCATGNVTTDASATQTFTTTVACPAPVLADVDPATITTTTATLTWTGSAASNFTVAYKTAIETDFTEVPATSSPFTFADGTLTPATVYTVMVKAVCGGSDGESEWSNTKTFTTECDAVAADGWSENFDDDATGSLPICWNRINEGTSYTSYPYVTSSNPNSTPNTLYFYTYGSSTSTSIADQYAVLPEMTGLAGMRFTLQARGYNANSNFKVGLMSDPTDASTFMEITNDGNPTITTGYQEYYFDIPTTATESHVAIMMPKPTSTSSSTYSVYIDDISIAPIPSCQKPTAPEVTATTATTATLSWTENGSATAWQICINNDETNLIDANTNPFTVPGLTPATTYTAKVRAYCNATEQSEWSNTIQFTTDCEAITTLPWSEDFEGFTANTVPTCWDNSASTSSTLSYYPERIWGVYEYSSNKMIRMYNYNVNNGTALINSPSIELPTSGVYALSFDYAHNANCGNFTVKVSTDNGANFTDLASYSKGSGSSSSDPGTFTSADPISLGSYAGQTIILQFFANANYGSGAIFVDNIKIDLVHTITATANPTEGGTVTGAGNYLHGTSATLTATANEGYHFVNWTKGGSVVSTNANYEFTVTEAGDYVANFVLNSYEITASANPTEGGTITGAGDYNHGATATLTATANTGYHFVNWTKGGAVVSTNASYSFTVTEAGDYVANFELNSYEITATANPAAGGTITGAANYTHGDIAELTATANDGYRFVNWTKGGAEVSTNASYSFTVTEAGNYVANFAQDSYDKGIVGNEWYAIASPVHNSGDNQTLAGVSHLTDVDYDLFGYTESTGTWNKPTTVLERGKGYIYRAAADVTLNFVGINNSSVPAYTLSYACDDDDLKGFNLVGNPYPQSATLGMVCYSLKPEGIWYAQPATYQVPVCEAVLVQTNGTGNSVTFTTGSGAKGVTSALAFTVSNEEFEDVAYARFDNGESLPKIGHLTAEAPMLSIPVDSRRYAIANVGNDCESFNLAFRGTNGSYTLTLKDNMAQMGYVHLIDRATGRDIDMLRQSYTFSATGNDADRFTVKLSPDAIESTEGHFAYWNGDNWVVEGNGKLQVIDVVGRQVLSQEVDSQTTLSNAQFPGTGVYILRMAGKSQKIVVK